MILLDYYPGHRSLNAFWSYRTFIKIISRFFSSALYSEMLKSEKLSHQDASLRCLEMLLHRHSSYWVFLLKAGAIPPLVELLESNDKLEGIN